MKRAYSWLTIILLTFTFGVATTFIWFNYTYSPLSPDKNKKLSDLPILSYCELVNNADKYDGKIVRVKTEIKTGNHGEYLYDSNCPADEKIKTYYDATAAIFYDNSKDQEQIKQIRDKRKILRWTDPVEVITTGKFRKNKPTQNDSGLDRNAVFHFVFFSLESVSSEDK